MPLIGLIVPNCPPGIINIISDAQTESNDSVDSDEETALAQAASYSSDEYSDDDDHYD